LTVGAFEFVSCTFQFTLEFSDSVSDTVSLGSGELVFEFENPVFGIIESVGNLSSLLLSLLLKGTFPSLIGGIERTLSLVEGGCNCFQLRSSLGDFSGQVSLGAL
jgi:hypothetical protein